MLSNIYYLCGIMFLLIIFYDLIFYRLVDGNLFMYLEIYVDGLLYDIDVCVGIFYIICWINKNRVVG
jgi:hypothetical protein